MPDVIFPYPGGKAKLAGWITSNMPDHECYVEVFGGGAGLLINKEESEVEVYNDLDNDLVQFFEILKNRPDELIGWLKGVQSTHYNIEAPIPFAEELHSEWTDNFYNQNHPDDPIERAGRFFALRYFQWGSKYHDNSGFAYSKQSSDPRGFQNSIDRLENFAKRFSNIYIHNRDWSEIIDMYDGEDTLFYCDPPYVGTETHYKVRGFKHSKFMRELNKIDGKFLLSYNELPNGIDKYDWNMISKEAVFYIGNGKKGESRELEEKLIMNYDPENMSTFHSSSQTGLVDINQNTKEEKEEDETIKTEVEETDTVADDMDEFREFDSSFSNDTFSIDNNDNEEQEESKPKEDDANKFEGIATDDTDEVEEDNEQDEFEGFLEDVGV